jgi:hypothetical protein
MKILIFKIGNEILYPRYLTEGEDEKEEIDFVNRTCPSNVLGHDIIYLPTGETDPHGILQHIKTYEGEEAEQFDDWSNCCNEYGKQSAESMLECFEQWKKKFIIKNHENNKD